MMSISANYEGTYANLMRFVHEIDRSPRLLIIEALNAAPQQSGGTLNISMKIDTFVRDDGSSNELDLHHSSARNRRKLADSGRTGGGADCGVLHQPHARTCLSRRPPSRLPRRAMPVPLESQGPRTRSAQNAAGLTPQAPDTGGHAARPGRDSGFQAHA